MFVAVGAFRRQSRENEEQLDPGLSGQSFNDFSRPTKERTKLIGWLMTFAPIINASLFLLAQLLNRQTLEHGDVAIVINAFASLCGLYLWIRQPLLSNRVFAAIEFVVLTAIGCVAFTQRHPIGRISYAVVLMLVLLVGQTILSKRAAVALHCYGVFALVISDRLALQSISHFLVHGLFQATWITTSAALIAKVRNNLDLSMLQLRRQAARDTLTGLRNRASITESVESQLAQHGSNDVSTLFLVDLVRFKQINDTLGHRFGDAVLQEVGQRIAGFRFQQAAVVARLGGDEFVVFFPKGLSSKQSESARSQLLNVITEPMLIDSAQVTVEATIGEASSPRDGRDLGTLLHTADSAIYKKRVERFQTISAPHDEAATAQQTRLLADLNAAMSSDQLSLRYQPKVDVMSGRVVGVEALLRWLHPELGFVGPDQFIPLAESTGLIIDLTDRVIELAALQLREWKSTNIPLSIAINISPRSLVDETFPLRLDEAFRIANVSLANLVIEVTETAMMRDLDSVSKTIRALRDLGIRISIDDFGTGYCSLSYLRDLAVDELKIDKSFVIGMELEANAVIVRASIQLAHNLGLSVVAEGVETQSALDSLRDLGCNTVQGYFLARPMFGHEVLDWMQNFANPSLGAARKAVLT
jgi:diguanylate cyclase (GGDEF)-like protein